MAQYHEPPAKLTKAEWEQVAKDVGASGQAHAIKKLREAGNEPQRAGDLFAPEDVYSRGQGLINKMLGKADSVFALSRVFYTNTNDGTAREDRMLALVRKPK